MEFLRLMKEEDNENIKIEIITDDEYSDSSFSSIHLYKNDTKQIMSEDEEDEDDEDILSVNNSVTKDSFISKEQDENSKSDNHSQDSGDIDDQLSNDGEEMSDENSVLSNEMSDNEVYVQKENEMEEYSNQNSNQNIEKDDKIEEEEQVINEERNKIIEEVKAIDMKINNLKSKLSISPNILKIRFEKEINQLMNEKILKESLL
jgi:hypothetical protein